MMQLFMHYCLLLLIQRLGLSEGSGENDFSLQLKSINELGVNTIDLYIIGERTNAQLFTLH